MSECVWVYFVMLNFGGRGGGGCTTQPFLLSSSCIHSTNSSRLSYAHKPVLVLYCKNSCYTDTVGVAMSDEILTQNL